MKELLENGRLVLRLMQDARVPTWIKVVIPVFVAIYFFSPIDLIPDFLIGPGQLDDLGVILLGMSLIVRFSPKYIVEEHKRALGLEVDTSTVSGGPRGANNNWSTPPAGGTTQSSQQASDTIDGEYRVVPSDTNEQSYN